MNNTSIQQQQQQQDQQEQFSFNVECSLLHRFNDNKNSDDDTSSDSSSSSDSSIDENSNDSTIFSVRAWMMDPSQGLKIFSTSSSSLSSTTTELHQSSQQLSQEALRILSSNNKNKRKNLQHHKKNVLWSSDSRSATVFFDPVDDEFVLAVRITSAASSSCYCLSRKEVSDFADLALFVLTTDMPMDTIIPTGWLAGAASASGRRKPVSLKAVLSREALRQQIQQQQQQQQNTSAININNESTTTTTNKKKLPKSVRNFTNELKKRLEICSIWWLKNKRQEKWNISPSATTLSETTNAALKAANDPDWIEKLHFHLQSKFNVPFSVNVSPLMWSPTPSPAQTREDTQKDDDSRFFEDGWLMMQDKTVIGCTPVLDALKRKALQKSISLVASSVDELVSHIGELCAAPSASGGGLRLARPVIPPVVLFDVDVTSWLDSMSVLDFAEDQPSVANSSNIQPFSLPTTSSHFQPTTTKLSGWQDANAINNFVSPSGTTSTAPAAKRHRIIVASSAGGAFAPKGFSAAFFLTQSSVPFVGVPLSLARDIARTCLSDASSMWEQYTEERAARDNTPNPQLRQLFDSNQVLLHAVMSCSCDENDRNSSSATTSGDYLISGGSESAIRLLLGPPANQKSLDVSLEGSRKVSDIIANAQKELYHPPKAVEEQTHHAGKENQNQNQQQQQQQPSTSFLNGSFHERVLLQLKNESGILSSSSFASSSSSSRRVLTLKHPFLERNPLASNKEIEKHVTRRILAVVAPEDAGSARIALYSVPKKNFTETQAMHLGRLLPM